MKLALILKTQTPFGLMEDIVLFAPNFQIISKQYTVSVAL